MSSEAEQLDAHPLAASYYADQAVQRVVEVAEHVQLARDTYRIRLCSPALAEQITPGQFVMLRLPGRDDPLLGRPFALYDTWLEDGRPQGVDIVYLVIGKMTRQLARCRPGDAVELWGPLGNGFSAAPVEHLILVAGGIGQTPFLALGREFLGLRQYGSPPRRVASAKQVTLCYGARSADYLAGVDDFRDVGMEVRISTDDGSAGRHGFVTDLLAEMLPTVAVEKTRVACCGPEPMMERVAEQCLAANVPCQASLETPMACGIGICFSCVAKVRQADGEWDYKRTCVEGPVFDAEKLVW